MAFREPFRQPTATSTWRQMKNMCKTENNTANVYKRAFFTLQHSVPKYSIVYVDVILFSVTFYTSSNENAISQEKSVRKEAEFASRCWGKSRKLSE